jgi:hypothetical protein
LEFVMRKVFMVVSVFGLGVIADRMLEGVHRNAEATEGQAGGVEKCSTKSGDVNADDHIDISDAVTILGKGVSS